LFGDMIAKDRAYRERLKAHYAMWRKVVDDPSHPDHATVAVGARKKAGDANGLALVAAKAGRAASKRQQRLRRLPGKVDALRERVREWKTVRQHIDGEIAAYRARFDRQRRLDAELVRALDKAYENPTLSKPERKKIAGLICQIAGDLLERGGDEDVKQIYNRYSGGDFDAEAAAADAANAAALKGMIEMMGIELGD